MNLTPSALPFISAARGRSETGRGAAWGHRGRGTDDDELTSAVDDTDDGAGARPLLSGGAAAYLVTTLDGVAEMLWLYGRGARDCRDSTAARSLRLIPLRGRVPRARESVEWPVLSVMCVARRNNAYA